MSPFGYLAIRLLLPRSKPVNAVFPRSSRPSSASVAPSVKELLEPERDHHWCIPFSVKGNPKPDLQWYHESMPLQEQDYIRTRIHESTESEYHGCLQLVNPTHIHNGMYKLVATNTYGQDEKTVSAQFIEPPNFNHTGLAALRSLSAALLFGNANMGSVFLFYFQQKTLSTTVSTDPAYAR